MKKVPGLFSFRATLTLRFIGIHRFIALAHLVPNSDEKLAGLPER